MARSLAVVSLLFMSSEPQALATEAERVVAVAPENVFSGAFVFQSNFAQGVRIEIGEANPQGVRTLSLVGCGSEARRTLTTTLNATGRVLIAYELSDGEQLRDTCSVNFEVFFTDTHWGSGQLVANSVAVLFWQEKFYVGVAP